MLSAQTPECGINQWVITLCFDAPDLPQNGRRMASGRPRDSAYRHTLFRVSQIKLDGGWYPFWKIRSYVRRAVSKRESFVFHKDATSLRISDLTKIRLNPEVKLIT